MSATEKMCLIRLRPLRALIPLNYMSPLIRFFKPLNPLILYTFFSIVMLLRTNTHAQLGDRKRLTGDVRKDM